LIDRVRTRSHWTVPFVFMTKNNDDLVLIV
jgi:hypothetical protein